jgi:tetratricopeptide (TPR) repeat protein
MTKPFIISLICLVCISKLNAQPSATVANLYSEGVKLKNAGSYDEALTTFKEAIEKNPENADALYEAGWLSNELKEYDDAVAYLQKAKQLKATATIFFELGYAYENSGKKNEATETYKKALELYPKYDDAAKHLGDIYYEDENYATALNYYKRYFEVTKVADTYYYYKAGQCLNNLGDYGEAILYLEKFEPHGRKDFTKKYTEIGYAYYKSGYNDDAISAYQKALEANPADGAVLRGIADVYYNNLEDYNKALDYMNSALQYDEKNSGDCYYKTGWIYIQQKKYEQAIVVLEKAADFDTKDADSREQLGYAYYMLNKYDEAILQFNKAIELDAQSGPGYFYKGLSYASLNQKGNAMEAYVQLKLIDKGNAEQLLKEIKQKEKVIKSLTSKRNSKKQADQ